jgi:hypothetical protein
VQKVFCINLKKAVRLTTMSFPAFSGLLPRFIAAAAAAPDEIPTCNKHALTFSTELENQEDQQQKSCRNYLF